MKQQFDVVVVGGGVVGLTAALAMAQRDYSVAILDAGSLTVSLTTPDPRVYAINQASRALFQKSGVWSRINPASLSPYKHMHVWDAANGSCIDFDARMVACTELGFILEESVIRKALLQQLAESPQVAFFPQGSVTQLKHQKESISVISNQGAHEAKLLIVADGRESVTRDLLQVPLTSWPYHQHALVAQVITEKAHQETAYQVFNSDGPLAFLPLVNSRECSIVWSIPPKRAEYLMGLSDDLFNEELGRAFANRLGQVRLAGKRYQFPLFMRQAGVYAGSNWLLMGDAAHTIHPLAGLGLNLGLADVASWLAYLDAAASKPVFGKITPAWQRERKHAVWQVILLMEGLKTLFTNVLPPVVAIRGLGLKWCNNRNFLKRLFIGHAAGKAS